jgi:hypothetical protein
MLNEENPQIHNRNNVRKRRYTIDKQEPCHIMRERQKCSSEHTSVLMIIITAGFRIFFICKLATTGFSLNL